MIGFESILFNIEFCYIWAGILNYFYTSDLIERQIYLNTIITFKGKEE